MQREIQYNFLNHYRNCSARRAVVPSELMWPLGVSVFGLRLWNSLSRLLRDYGHNTTSFGHSLKTFFLPQY